MTARARLKLTARQESWIAKACARVAGYAEARGFRLTGPQLIPYWSYAKPCPQIVCGLRDRAGNYAEIFFISPADNPAFLDEYGLELEFTAATFDTLTAELIRRQRPNRRQLSLAL